jgi:uncharacterized protein YyaL (SSP411 family)
MYAGRPGEKPEARGTAFLEDYAFLTHGLLALHDATGKAKWLDEAKAVTDQMTKWHGDEKRGAYFMTAHDAEKLFARGKDYYDGAQPSGNGRPRRRSASSRRFCAGTPRRPRSRPRRWTGSWN